MRETRRIKFEGADPDYMYFSTPSWSRAKLRHDIVVDKRTGIIRCRCEDAVCRKKKGDILDRESPEPCQHVRALLKSFEMIIREGIETAISG